MTNTIKFKMEKFDGTLECDSLKLKNILLCKGLILLDNEKSNDMY